MVLLITSLFLAAYLLPALLFGLHSRQTGDPYTRDLWIGLRRVLIVYGVAGVGVVALSVLD